MKVLVSNIRAMLSNAHRLETGATRRYISVTMTAPAMALGNQALRLVTWPNGRAVSQMNSVESPR